MRPNVRIETLARRGKNVERQLLENALASSQNLSQFAMDAGNFGSGRAGAFGALAQGLTAGVGAFAQYKNQQKLAQLNSEDADAFAQFATEKGNPELANVASRLSPESREAYYLSMALPQSQNSNIPSAIREFEYYKTLPKEQQSQYLGVKRNIAGEGAIVGSTGEISTLEGYGQAGAQKTGMEQTAKNVSDYKFAEPTAQAKAKGTEVGKKLGEEEKKAIQAPITIDLINQAETLLPKATSGSLQNLGIKGTEIVGLNTKMGQTDAQLKAISAQLILNVPRMEGPQSDKDTVLYREAAGNIANANIPYKTRLASLKTIKSINEKYLPQNVGGVRVNNQNVDPNQMGLDLTTMMGNQRNPQQKPASNIKFLGFE
jgi:hypothetical protein